jgi:hypothetical protein
MAKKILIVTTVDRPREYTANLKNIFEEDLGLETKITDLESLAFFCRNGKVDISIDSESIDNYSAVYIKHWHAAEEAAFVLTHYAIRHVSQLFHLNVLESCLRQNLAKLSTWR